MNWAIKLSPGLCRLGRRTVLEVPELQLKPGEHWCFLGANGSGKSTLANLINGKRHESGSYVSYAADLNPAQDIVEVSFSAQQHLLELDARHDISEFSATVSDNGTCVAVCVKKMRRADDPEFFAELCAALDLEQLLGKGIRYLSSGQLRRVMIARALYAQEQGIAKVLILDEPVESLDRATSASIGKIIHQFLQPATITINLARRESSVPEFTTHMGLMQRNDERLRLVATDRMEVVKKSTAYRDFAARQPVIPTAWSFDTDMESRAEQGAVPLIEMRGVNANYGELQVLQGLHWTMSADDHVLVEGPNGCGKSTLLSLIDGENHKGYGQPLLLFGQRKGSGESIWELKANFGIVSNELHNKYIRGWKVLEVIVSGFYDTVGLYDDSGTSERTAAQTWLELIGLAASARHYYHELSFGEQRLVLLARAMVKQPRILVLDEPCVGLDNYYRQLTLGLLDLVASHANTQILYVSHTRGEHPQCINQHLEFLPAGSGAYSLRQTTR